MNVIIKKKIIAIFKKIQRNKIYIAFSYKDKIIKDQLVKCLEKELATCSEKHRELIVQWNDDWIKEGYDFEKKVKTEIKEAKVVVLLLSKSFLSASPNEISIIEENRGKELKVLIVPVNETCKYDILNQSELDEKVKKRFNLLKKDDFFEESVVCNNGNQKFIEKIKTILQLNKNETENINDDYNKINNSGNSSNDDIDKKKRQEEHNDNLEKILNKNKTSIQQIIQQYSNDNLKYLLKMPLTTIFGQRWNDDDLKKQVLIINKNILTNIVTKIMEMYK